MTQSRSAWEPTSLSLRAKTGRRVKILEMMEIPSGPGHLLPPRKSSHRNKALWARFKASALGKSRQQVYPATGFKNKKGGTQEQLERVLSSGQASCSWILLGWNTAEALWACTSQQSRTHSFRPFRLFILPAPTSAGCTHWTFSPAAVEQEWIEIVRLWDLLFRDAGEETKNPFLS